MASQTSARLHAIVATAPLLVLLACPATGVTPGLTAGNPNPFGPGTTTSTVDTESDPTMGSVDTDAGTMGATGMGTGDTGPDPDTGNPPDSSGGPGVCGDGMVDPGEDCDDGGETAACNDDCTVAMCGDTIVNVAAGEECDDGGETASCDLDCTMATCGDGTLNEAALEACDDGGESAVCDADCTMAECGDMTINATALEDCDDGNMVDTDACVGCVAASCGDGFLQAGVEACDDGNLTDLDACTNACAFGSVLVSGNANTYLTQAMSALGEAYSSNASEWATPLAAGVIIMGRDGGSSTAPAYQPHLDAGAHLLMVGGSSLTAFGDWINTFVSSSGNVGWHQSSSCVSDFNVSGAHPITALLPASYEFSNQSVSYHMVHFNAVGQPADTELLATSCEPGPNNYIAITRRYPSGGTFTYLASDAGNYTGAGVSAGFLEPFLEGYLAYIRSPAP